MVGISLAQLRDRLGTGVLTADQRRFVLRQAATMIEAVYVHLPQKRAMYAIDPVQRLRLLELRLAQFTDAQFHAELHAILNELRDAHTTYGLPGDYRGRHASLGIRIERCWEADTPHWIVTKVNQAFVNDPRLVPGVEITHWSGSLMADAVVRNADREAGSNPSARLARGLERMTQRPLFLSPLPDEEWVDLTCLIDGVSAQIRIPWQVVTATDLLAADIAVPLALLDPPGATSEIVGLDLRTELVRRADKAMFAPEVIEQERLAAANRGNVPPATEDQVASDGLPTKRPDELRAGVVTTPAGRFGYLRIKTFHINDYPDVADDVGEFIGEVRRLLTLMPPAGLIIDIRRNPGGYVRAAETLLQFLTPRTIQSVQAQLISTPHTADLCFKVDGYRQWHDSIKQSTETGAQYSRGFPITGQVNNVGQIYYGPVVLITDALLYSASDIFSAGFADHQIGEIIGVDDNTGAGGAAVWELADFLTRWAECPFEPLPAGAQLRVALLRIVRVGTRAGQLLEDLGVTPDVHHRMTRRDHLERNIDLLAKAGELLAAKTPAGQSPRDLNAVFVSRDGAMVTLDLTTSALDSIDIYVNGRPVATTGVRDGTAPVTIPVPADGAAAQVRILGFTKDKLVAARNLIIAG